MFAAVDHKSDSGSVYRRLSAGWRAISRTWWTTEVRWSGETCHSVGRWDLSDVWSGVVGELQRQSCFTCMETTWEKMASGMASRTDSSQIETAFRHVQNTALDVWMSIGLTMALYLRDTERETTFKQKNSAADMFPCSDNLKYVTRDAVGGRWTLRGCVESSRLYRLWGENKMKHCLLDKQPDDVRHQPH